MFVHSANCAVSLIAPTVFARHFTKFPGLEHIACIVARASQKELRFTPSCAGICCRLYTNSGNRPAKDLKKGLSTFKLGKGHKLLGPHLVIVSSVNSSVNHRNKASYGNVEKSQKGPVTWTSLAIAACIGAVAVFFVRREIAKKDKEVQRVQTIGKMDVGGPWEGLIDHKGHVRSSKDFSGQWLLMYFGFTHCPDICPDELEKLVGAVEIVDDTPHCPTIQPIFLSIDPFRDTPSRVADYIKDFSPKIIGLTGGKEKVAQIARLFRVYSSEGPKDEDDDYIVDHSIITYLIDPNGECVTFFTKNQDMRRVANTIMLQMKEFEVQNRKKQKISQVANT